MEMPRAEKRSKTDDDDVTILGETLGSMMEYYDLHVKNSSKDFYLNRPVQDSMRDNIAALFKVHQTTLISWKKVEKLEMDLKNDLCDLKAVDVAHKREMEVAEKLLEEANHKIKVLEAETEDNALCMGLKARMEIMREYARMEHKSWNYVAEWKGYGSRYPDVIEGTKEAANRIAEAISANIAAEDAYSVAATNIPSTT